MTTKYKPGLVYCEMVKMDALVRHDPNTYRLLDYERGMHPIGAQLCGSRLQMAAVCARIVEDLGFDVVDFNCGCPVDKVTKDGSGSGMLKTPERIGEHIAAMVAAVKIPVTVKVRAGWDATSLIAPDIVKIAEEAGAAAICIHGRTRAQGYQGFADLDVIRACKMAAKNILVIGNGDIFDGPSAERMFSHTGCDAILVARGTMGAPWVIEDIYRHLSQENPLVRTAKDLRDAFLLHLEHVVSYQPERKALLDLRRIGCWYLRKAKGVRALRELVNRAQSVQEVQAMILAHPWEEEVIQAVQEPL
jgi:nifR3 family TIM-barrel protein